eukprot:CAMPEP_0170427150 /NCGR_PEP_ID=MMETSP0117_2-20130122/39060_1 /TAXON_ID=400756 /ORGANISM="Durinskia baltica, Strain CSIRO CS-38" /LENGTH=30 /DNA_ID= /DNA_START= /DNA_END= /DNA_ORIENTATION=
MATGRNKTADVKLKLRTTQLTWPDALQSEA